MIKMTGLGCLMEKLQEVKSSTSNWYNNLRNRQSPIDTNLTHINQIVNQVFSKVFNSDYRPNVIYAKTDKEFEYHVRQESPDLASKRMCHYSRTSKKSIIHPEIVRPLQSNGREYDKLMKLRAFQHVLHEAMHGYVDHITDGVYTLPAELARTSDKDKAIAFVIEHLVPLEEYVVSLSANEIAIDFHKRVVGEGLQSDANAFMGDNRPTSLSNEEEKRIGDLFGISEFPEEVIARFFLKSLMSAESYREDIIIYYLNVIIPQT